MAGMPPTKPMDAKINEPMGKKTLVSLSLLGAISDCPYRS